MATRGESAEVKQGTAETAEAAGAQEVGGAVAVAGPAAAKT